MRPSITSRPGLHVSAFYFALFSAAGAHVSFWPVWARDWGLSAAEVGVFAAWMMLARITGGLVGPIIADRRQNPKALMLLSGLACSAIFALHPWIGTRAVLLVASMAGMGLYAAMLPVGEALSNVAARDRGFPYAQARSFGPMGFLVASLTVGSLIGLLGPNLVVWWIAAAILAAAILGWRHPGGRLDSPPDRPTRAEFRALFTARAFVLFALSTAAIRAGQGVLNTYGTLHWQTLGLSDSLIGALWAFALVAEIAFMFLLGPRLLRLLGPVGMIMFAGVASMLRWAAMSLDPTGVALWLLQALHAASFGAGQLGMMRYIELAFPQRLAATAFGAAFGPVGGALMLVVTALAAWVYPAWGGGTYLIGAAFSALGLLLALGLARTMKDLPASR
jgi:MFS transporter, PPP family, 3-phenylpropionic acid transporter